MILVHAEAVKSTKIAAVEAEALKQLKVTIMWAKTELFTEKAHFYCAFIVFCRMAGDHSFSLKRYYVLAR